MITHTCQRCGATVQHEYKCRAWRPESEVVCPWMRSHIYHDCPKRKASELAAALAMVPKRRRTP